MNDSGMIKEFEDTEEYKAWQASLMAIIGFLNNKEFDDDELAGELMADHLKASLELQKGLDRAQYDTGKMEAEKYQAQFRDE